MDPALTTIAGEFADPGEEALFRTARAAEAIRHAKLLFGFSAVLNTLFLASDWRFSGTPHFAPAITARLCVVAASLLCWAAVRRQETPGRVEIVVAVWCAVTSAGVSFLVSTRSELALFVVLLLPLVMYLAVPGRFALVVTAGIGCTLALFGGFVVPSAEPGSELGLGLALATLNVALALVVSRQGRARRLEWAATRQERALREELALSNSLTEALLDAVPTPVMLIDREHPRLIKANEAAQRFFGPELTGEGSGGYFASGAGGAELFDLLRRWGATGRHEVALQRQDGAIRDTLVVARSVPIGGRECIVAAVTDLTEHRRP